MQDSILILVAQEGGAASASERKTRRESTQKARVVTSGRQAGRHPPQHKEERVWPGGKGLALPAFAKGQQDSGLPGSTPTASLSQGPGKTLKSPHPTVSVAACPHLPCARLSAVSRLLGQDSGIFASGKETLCQ